MRYCASRPSPAVDAKAMSVDIHRVAAASGSEGLTLMLEEFWVGRPKERDEISYEFPRRPAILCIRQRNKPCSFSLVFIIFVFLGTWLNS